MTGRKREQLLWYAGRGLPIFPCHWVEAGACSCANPGCKSPGKHPLVENGFYAATANPGQVEAWHRRWPEANWAVRTGPASGGGAGILVVDIDPRHSGDATWEMLRDENPGPLETVTVRTGGGGVHYWFQYPEGYVLSSKAGQLGPGVDIKAGGGYVLVPPSRTAQPYAFDLNPAETAIQALPGWILDRLGRPLRPGRAAGKTRREPADGIRPDAVHADTTRADRNPPEKIPVGERHNTLVALGAALRHKGLAPDEIRAALLTVRDQRFEEIDPDSEAEIESVVQWLAEKSPGYSPSDLGNAERFIDQHGQDVRFCYPWERWLVWNGKRWAADADGEVVRRAHETVKGIYAEAAGCADDGKRQALARHALASEARFRVEALLQSARPYLAVAPGQLDQHPTLLNCANGVINLEDGTLLPHDRKYMLTRMVDVPYDAGAQCPAWEKFLDLVTGNDGALKLFLHLAVGYTLTGRTDEHCLFFLYGTGKNGKSTFTETLRRLFNDYAQRTDIEAMLQSYAGRGAAASPYIANLAGARFVLASEMPEGRRLNEALVKDLTGGDSITARHLFGNPFTFAPTHKLWVFGNYKPRIGGTDEGFWRRVRVIPFQVAIPEALRRPMSEVLAEFEAELPGILAWAVLGCVLWKYNGLEMPPAVAEATRSYRGEQDLVQQFIDECCEMHPEHRIDKDELYRAWRSWCENAGEEGARSRSKRWLTQQFTMRGMEPGGKEQRQLVGMRLNKGKQGS